MRLLLVLLFLLLFLPGCRREVSDARLLRAESLVDDYPDSTLAILDSIGEEGVNGNLNRAAYAMLRGMAMDKANLIPTNDSAMMAAADVFASAGDRRREVITRYYLGRVRYLAGDYPGALLSFFQAKELAEQDSSHFWAGMSCRGIADVYHDSYNWADELVYARLENDYLQLSGKRRYICYGLYDLGMANLGNREYKEVEKISRQMLDSAQVYEDTTLHVLALQLLGQSLVNQSRFREALPIYSSLYESGCGETVDSLNYSLSLAETGGFEEALGLLRNTGDTEKPVKSLILYTIHRHTGNYKDALTEMESVHEITNEFFISSIGRKLNSTLADYHQVQADLSREKLRSSKLKLWLIGVLSAVFSISIMVLAYWKIRRQQGIVDAKVLLAEQLQETLTDSWKENESSRHIIRRLLDTRYDLLEHLIEIVISNKDSRKARRKIADTVTGLIEDMSVRGDRIEELGREVDSLYDNLFTDFRHDLPNLKEEDYRLYLFSIYRMSAAAISLLLGEEKTEAVYNRKRRLKDKIKTLDADKASRYLGVM